MENNYENIVEDVVNYSKKAYERKLVAGMAGNISCRFKNNDFDVIAITPTGTFLNDLKGEDIVLIDVDNNILTKGKPSSESLMHSYIYKNRKDINGIVHTHSPYATGFAFSDKKIRRLEGFGKIKTPYLKEIPYEKPGTKLLAEKTSEILEKDDCAILKDHGVISTGKSLKDAFTLAEYVEEIAKTQFISNNLK